MEISAKGDQVLFSAPFAGNQWSCNGGSRCIGTVARTYIQAVAVDPSGGVVFAGETNAIDLPVTLGALATSCACTDMSLRPRARL